MLNNSTLIDNIVYKYIEIFRVGSSATDGI